MNFTSNVCSLLVFFFLGLYRVDYALVMGIGQMAGARLGARTVIRRGTGFVRIFFLVIVALTLIKLALD